LEVVVHESAAIAIVTAAARMGADAIVMASHGRSGISKAVLGSQTERVLREARRPVLVVPLTST
jgi:nucleotide-binding universal stress UspA family protein